MFEEDFVGSLKLLMTAIETDHEWAREHTEWGRRALEWDRHGRDRAFLLSGAELETAEGWRQRASGKQPAPTPLHSEFIDASRQAVTQRLRRTRGFVSGALVVAIGLAVLAFVQRQIAISNQHAAQSLQLATSAEATLSKDPELSTLLALRALRVRNTPQAVQALRDALPQVHVLGTLRPGATVFGAAFSPDGKEIVTASGDGTARIWSASGHQQLAVLTEPGGRGLSSAAFSRDGKEIVTASYDGTTRIWSASGHQQLAVLTEPGGSTRPGAAFSPDSKEIVTTSDNGAGRARIWSAGGQQLGVLTEPGGSPFYGAFSPNGKEIVTASGEGTARIWSASGHQQLAVLTEPGAGGLYSAPAFSPDGEEIVTASGDGTARIWSASGHQQLAVFTVPGGSPLYGVAFSPDGKEIVTASADGTARIWSTELAGSARAVERIAEMRVTRQLTTSERKTYLAGI